MLHDIPYLTVTAKTKVYGYRRRIPKDVRYMFSNKSEIVRSLKTKSLAVAQVEVDRLNRWFDERLETVGYSRKQDNLLPAELVRKVHDDLKMMGEHPDDVPMIGIRSDLDEVRKLAKDFAYSQNVYKDYKSGQITYDNFLELDHSYNNGIYGKILNHHERANLLLEELHSKYHDGLKWDEHDPEVVRYRLMMGENLVPPSDMAKRHR